MKKKTWLQRLWADRSLVLMALPAVIIMILFSYVPMSGLVLAFKSYNFKDGIYGSPWVGLDNFKHLFLVGDIYWRITRNTIGYYLLLTAFGTVCNVGLALMINELLFKKAGKYLHSVMILPTFISYIAISYVVGAFLDYNQGIVNNLIEAGGGERISFYMQPQYWPFILVFVSLWKGTGYGSVLYLSTLAGIDQGLYESADIDGATAWDKVRYISIPMLVPIIAINLLLGLGNIMKSDTGLFYQVTRNTGALFNATQTIDAYLLNAIQSGTGWGVSAAATFYQSVVGCVMLILVNSIVRRKSPEHALF